MSKVILKNIGTIVSGDISNPLIEGDAITIGEGMVRRIGRFEESGIEKGDTVIDCDGMTVTPGLIDSHCHVVLGDYAPRQ